MKQWRRLFPVEPLNATVRPPGSKSITNRVLIVAALAQGHSVLSDVLLAEDTRLMLECLRGLGIRVTVDGNERSVEVTGCRGFPPANEAEMFCGNSGTTLRFAAAMSALGQGRFVFDGVPRMRQRPVGKLVEALRALGAGVEFLEAEGYPPFALHAKGLHGGRVAFERAESSQFISALLMATAYATDDVFIEVTGQVVSAPYLRMTTHVMDQFGVSVVAQYEGEPVNIARFIVPASQQYHGRNYAIEPDASNATYFLAAPAIAAGSVTVEGLGTDSAQGDTRFVDVLARMGCLVERSADQLTVQAPEAGGALRGIDVDLNDMPDTVPTLAVLALFAEGPTHIRNVANLRVKETDRLAALATELSKLGAEVSEHPDGLSISPPEQLTPAAINTYDDHRMAMSFALAALASDEVVINDPDCCAKTYPSFFTDFQQMWPSAS